MAKGNISSVSSVNTSFESLKKYAERIIEKLRRQYAKTIAENTYYKEPKRIKLVILFAVALEMLYWATLRRADLKFFDQFDNMSIKSSMVEKIIVYTVYMLAFWLLYKAVVIIYCMRLQEYSKRIDNIEKTLVDRIDELNSSSMKNNLMSAINSNIEYDFPVKNDIGEMINAFNKDLSEMNKKAYNIRKIVRIAVTAIAFLILYIFDIRFWIQNGSESVEFAVPFLIIETAIFAHVLEFNLGEYLGKVAKPLGIAAAGVSCIFMMLGMKKIMPGDFLEYSIPVNKCYIVVPLIAFIGIAVSVGFSHYASEKEKWQNGFVVPMEYGEKNDGNKKTLLIRGGISLVLAASAILASVMFKQVGEFIIVGVLWYLANPLMKPRGSYIYTFFGRGKCIGNEIIMVSICLFLQLKAVNIFGEEWIVFAVLAVAFRFLSAAVAKFINDWI